MTPLVSIVTPLYNSEKHCADTVGSVLAQTFEAWELLVVDDASTDGSREIIERIALEEPRIRLIRQQANSGPAVARNRGIDEARGRYIAFLDSDDLWHPDKLEKQLGFMRDQDAAFSFTAYNLIDERSGKFFGVHRVPAALTYDRLLRGNLIGCSTVIYDTHKLGKIMFPIIRKRQDFALWLAILKRVEFGYGLDEPLTDYTVRSGSVSSNRLCAAYYTWKVYRDIEKLPLLESLFYLSKHLIKGILKYWIKKQNESN